MEKALVDTWMKEVDKINREYLSIKELAFILDVSYNKIRRDIRKALLIATKLGEADSRSEIRIYKSNIKEYLEKFEMD